MISVSFSICCLLFMSILSIIYFSKQKMDNFDNKLYSILLILNFIGIIIDVSGYFSFKLLGSDFIINHIISKIYLLYYISYIFCLMIYVYNLTFKNLKKIIKKLIISFIGICVVIFCLPINIHFKNNSAYTYGMSVNLSYALAFIFIIVMIFCLFKSIKKINNKEYIPLIMFILLTFLCLFIQKLFPSITLLLTCNSIVTFLMYFTIENPDVKQLNEMYKNNELVEQTYIDKSNFLFEMTGEVREPIKNMTLICNDIKETNDIKDINKGITLLSNSLKQLDFVVNDVLNISTLDVQKVKFIENRYNINSLYDDLIVRIKKEVNSNVNFRSEIPNNIPYLYGDSIKLKQVLYSLIMNSIKKTKEGFIEFNVNIIERFDICRIIFTIQDSGTGMSLDKINEILSTTGEFDSSDIENLEKSELNIKLCQKIIKTLGGNLLIKSKINEGTKIILTIDQKKYIETKNSKYLEQLESIFETKRVLVVCQDKDIISLIKKKFNDYNISGTYIMYGIDAVDNIKRGKKYDYIIMSDDMKDISGYETLKKLKTIIKFNIPIIVLLNENKEKIKEDYIKDGFSDYILMNKFTDELDRIVEKY